MAPKAYSSLGPFADKPYAIGERPGGNYIPTIPLLSGNDAWNSIRPYYDRRLSLGYDTSAAGPRNELDMFNKSARALYKLAVNPRRRLYQRMYGRKGGRSSGIPPLFRNQQRAQIANQARQRAQQTIPQPKQPGAPLSRRDAAIALGIPTVTAGTLVGADYAANRLASGYQSAVRDAPYTGPATTPAVAGQSGQPTGLDLAVGMAGGAPAATGQSGQPTGLDLAVGMAGGAPAATGTQVAQSQPQSTPKTQPQGGFFSQYGLPMAGGAAGALILYELLRRWRESQQTKEERRLLGLEKESVLKRASDQHPVLFGFLLACADHGLTTKQAAVAIGAACDRCPDLVHELEKSAGLQQELQFMQQQAVLERVKQAFVGRAVPLSPKPTANLTQPTTPKAPTPAQPAYTLGAGKDMPIERLREVPQSFFRTG